MNNDSDIKYSNYYVAFLDILGFKNLVKSEKPEDIQKISKYFQLIKEITNDLKKIEPKKNIGSIIISDSVILSVRIGTDQLENIKNLRQLCIAIQKIQFKLAEINIWLRGAISSGKAYFNATDSQVVGPAYINAYLLEERLAINPRVILDNKLITELGLDSAQTLIDRINTFPTISNEYDALKSNILFQWNHNGIPKNGLTKDVAFFVDYLVYAFEDELKLKTIVENIEQNIYSDNNIYSKYRWVADYLIASCQHHKDNMPCNIESSLLREQYNRLQML